MYWVPVTTTTEPVLGQVRDLVLSSDPWWWGWMWIVPVLVVVGLVRLLARWDREDREARINDALRVAVQKSILRAAQERDEVVEWIDAQQAAIRERMGL